jgi:putative acetyltransferase
VSALLVRPETAADAAIVHGLVADAFGQEAEALLVDRLRRAGTLALSLLAFEQGRAVGHVAFSPLTIGHADGGGPWLGLAPLAVARAHRRRGIGARLVEEGLAACRGAGASLVCVLGDPAYYRRFGFRPAGEMGLACEYPVPAEYFMALRLAAGPPPPGGIVRYHPAFAEL